MTAQLKHFPKSPVREVNTVEIANRLDRLAMKSEVISLALHGVMEIEGAGRLADPVALLVDVLSADLRELRNEVHSN
jgi:hypothetical protein